MLPIEWICECMSNSLSVPSVQQVMQALSSHSECDSTHCSEEMVPLSHTSGQGQLSIAPFLFAVAVVATLYATRPPSLRDASQKERRE